MVLWSCVGCEEDDDIGDEGDMMNWLYFGCFVVILYICCLVFLGFFFGFFLVEKKICKIIKCSVFFCLNNFIEICFEVFDVNNFNKKGDDFIMNCVSIL